MDLSSYVLPKTKIVNERQHLLSIAVERINAERAGTKWKPVQPKRIAIMTSHVPMNDLRDFIYQCEKSTEFGRCFFGRLKIKK